MFLKFTLSSLFFLTIAVFANEDAFQLETDITGGKSANIAGFKKFSLVIGTLHRTENGAFYPIHSCGASFIQRYPPALALTAAHCVKPIKGPGGGWTDPKNPNEYWAFRGWSGPAGNVQFKSGDFRAYRIEKVYFPEAWRKSNQPIFGDIAVLQLDYGEDGRWLFNIPIATPAISKALITYPMNPDNKMKTFKEEITGWGKDAKTNEFALTVQSGTVYHIPKDMCNIWVNGLKKYLELGLNVKGWENFVDFTLKDYKTKADKHDLIEKLMGEMYHTFEVEELKHYVFDDERCAMDIKEAKTSNCYGDSGGPLVYHNPDPTADNIFTLMGVTSSSIAGDCSPYMPVMYSNLEYYTDWIKSIHACIMVEKMDEWDTEIKNDPTGQGHRKYWYGQYQFWRNGGKTGRIPSMEWRALRNRFTQFAFKKFYVGYMRKWKQTMQAWCDKRTEIEAVFTDANKEGWGELTHTSDRVDLPGFFPAMVEYSEWLKQHRREKYIRAWGEPFIISTEKRLITNPMTKTVNVEDNLSVSMDLWKGTINKARLVYIPGILDVRYEGGSTEIRVGSDMKLVCSHDMSWEGGWHIEISLLWMYNKITYVVNGSEQHSCTKRIKWRPHNGDVYTKTFYWGSRIRTVQSAYAKNIEYRTWTDPPVCCKEWNIPGRCIVGC